MSYDHLGNGWSNRILLAGYKVALRQLLGRGNNALMAGYFPQGMPFVHAVATSGYVSAACEHYESCVHLLYGTYS